MPTAPAAVPPTAVRPGLAITTRYAGYHAQLPVETAAAAVDSANLSVGGVPACLTPNTGKSPCGVVSSPPAMSASDAEAGRDDAAMLVATSVIPGAEIVSAPVGAGLG